MYGRIKFLGNPWPDGHPLKDFRLGVLLHESRGDIPAKATLDLRFRSEDYCYPATSDVELSNIQDKEAPKWESINSWLSYGAAYATSIASHEDMVIADTKSGFDIECLNDFTRVIDPIPDTITDDDTKLEIPAFHSHILSWDDMADHHMTIKRNPNSGLYDVYWKGKCDRSEIGNYRFQHEFEIEVSDVPFSGYSGHKLSWQEQARVSLEERDLELRSLLKSLVVNPGKMQFKTGHFPGRDQLLPD